MLVSTHQLFVCHFRGRNEESSGGTNSRNNNRESPASTETEEIIENDHQNGDTSPAKNLVVPSSKSSPQEKRAKSQSPDDSKEQPLSSADEPCNGVKEEPLMQQHDLISEQIEAENARQPNEISCSPPSEGNSLPFPSSAAVNGGGEPPSEGEEPPEKSRFHQFIMGSSPEESAVHSTAVADIQPNIGIGESFYCNILFGRERTDFFFVSLFFFLSDFIFKKTLLEKLQY